MPDFKENLPSQCPPADAKSTEFPEVWRAVRNGVPSEGDFLSHAALGKENTKGTDACRFASCSFFSKREALLDIFKFPTVRSECSHMVSLRIPENCGRHKKKRKHVDFWAYQGFSFCGCVVRVEAV